MVVAGVPLLALLVSLAAALARPPLYSGSTELLVTHSAEPELTAGLTPDGSDKAAQDLPAIVAGAPFRRDLAAELARQGYSPELAADAVRATRDNRVVTLVTRAAAPEEAVALAHASAALIQRNGLRYWGDPQASPERPGLNIAVLGLSETAVQVNGPRAIAIEVGLRTLTGLLAGIGLAFLLYYVNFEARTLNQRAPETKPSGDYSAASKTAKGSTE